ncbi:MAG: adenylate/guanylate cyclase domain-containing protein [Acidimicrobiales bacterium]
MPPGVITVENVTRVQRTFAFIDICGFTAYTDSEGDAAAVALLEGVRGNIRRFASIHGVRVAKWLGDGAMLVAVEPEHAIEAVVAIVEHNRAVGGRSLRAGVANGPVILFEGDDHIGRAINLASRLSDLAGPDEILAPATMHSSMLVNTRVLPAGSCEVRGFAEPVELVRLEPGEGPAIGD